MITLGYKPETDDLAHADRIFRTAQVHIGIGDNDDSKYFIVERTRFLNEPAEMMYELAEGVEDADETDCVDLYSVSSHGNLAPARLVEILSAAHRHTPNGRYPEIWLEK